MNMDKEIIIPIVEYGISDIHTSYHLYNKIYFGMATVHGLNDNELSEYVCDTITHEFIHHILENIFPKPVTYLFDTIGDSLRDRIDLMHRVVQSKNIQYDSSAMLWCDIVKQFGFIGFIDRYEYLSNNLDVVIQLLKDGC